MWFRNPLRGYGVALLLIVAIAILFTGYLYWQWINALKQVSLEQENTSKTVALHVEQSILAVDLVLRSVTDEVAEARLKTVAELRKKMGSRAIFEKIKSRKAGIEQLSVVSIVDKHGDMVNFTRNFPPRSDEGKTINLAERDYFKAHLDSRAQILFISSPVKNKGTGTWTFYLTRKIQNASGDMIGLVLAGIESAYFENYFRAIAEVGKSYSLFLETGIVLALVPENEAALGKAYPDSPVFKTLRSGLPSAVLAPGFDPAAVPLLNSLDYRIIAPTQVRSYPLVVNVRAGQSVIVAMWRKTWIGVGAFALALWALILLTAWARQRTLLHREITLSEQARARAMHDALVLDYNEQLTAVFSLSPDAFVCFDRAHRVKYLNPAFARLTGLEDGEIIGLDEVAFSERLSGACLPQGNFCGTVALRTVRNVKAGAEGAAPAVREWREKIELAGAGKRVLEVSLRESTAASVAQILYLRDVTHETEVERLKSEFVSTAAHELRTPMASIYGFTEMLLKQELSDADRHDFLETIFRHSEMMISIINELLDLARIEARGGKDFSFERVSVRSLVNEIVSGFKTPAGRLSPEVPLPNGVLWVRGDRQKLTQAMNNALSNAYKYSPAGGAVSIEFVHPASDAPGSGAPLVGIRITDQGIGMTPEQLSRVFERFYRADTSGKIPGTGLGMSIVHEIVGLHGGKINIDSQLGAGTAVTIWLPCAANARVLPAQSLESAAL